MIDLAGSPLAVALLVVVLSFVGAIVSDKIRVSYTTVMIAIGLVLSYLKVAGELGSIPFDSSIILGLIVPPVIFEAAMRTRFAVFRTVQKTVLALAVFGVAISAVLSGFALNIASGRYDLSSR